MSTTIMAETETKATDPACIELQQMRTSPRPPTHAVAITQQDGLVPDKTNITRILIVGFSYIFAGLNDGSLGALTPYMLVR